MSNIVLLSDGTGNSAAKRHRTNVWRLYEALDLHGHDQIAFYDDGVGSKEFVLFKLLGGVFGWGLRNNVIELYKTLCRNYKRGDKIYLFSFSRGAFTSRRSAIPEPQRRRPASTRASDVRRGTPCGAATAPIAGHPCEPSRVPESIAAQASGPASESGASRPRLPRCAVAFRLPQPEERPRVVVVSIHRSRQLLGAAAPETRVDQPFEDLAPDPRQNPFAQRVPPCVPARWD